MKRLLFVVGASLAVLAVSAQRVIDVSKQGEGKIAINLSGFRTGNDAASRTFLSVLKADLNRSGYFRVTSGGGTVSVTGTCASGGNQMKAKCQVYGQGRVWSATRWHQHSLELWQRFVERFLSIFCSHDGNVTGGILDNRIEGRAQQIPAPAPPTAPVKQNQVCRLLAGGGQYLSRWIVTGLHDDAHRDLTAQFRYRQPAWTLSTGGHAQDCDLSGMGLS